MRGPLIPGVIRCAEWAW